MNIIKILKKAYRFLKIIEQCIIKNTIYFYIPNLKTILFCKKNVIGKSNIFHQKTYVTGKGKVILGDRISYGYKLGGYWRNGNIEIQARGRESIIEIGSNVSMNNNVLICCKKHIKIGEDTLIGHNCEFLDFDGHGIAPTERISSEGLEEEIIIGKNVWFGNNCTILRGTSIGNNCIIANGSIVKGKFTDNVIIGGVPAKIIKQIE